MPLGASKPDYKTALVTGASSGIGAACVRALAAEGLAVTATARRADRLEALAAETGCTPLALDLRDTDAVYERLSGLEVDVLVNNAGLGRGYEGFLKSSKDQIDEMIEVNVSAAIHVVRAVAEGMAARTRGHIVNIGSIAGLYPIGFPVYGATKGAVHLFGQHLRIDLAGRGVRLTEICPGADRDRVLRDRLQDRRRPRGLHGRLRGAAARGRGRLHPLRDLGPGPGQHQHHRDHPDRTEPGRGGDQGGGVIRAVE